MCHYASCEIGLHERAFGVIFRCYESDLVRYEKTDYVNIAEAKFTFSHFHTKICVQLFLIIIYNIIYYIYYGHFTKLHRCVNL